MLTTVQKSDAEITGQVVKELRWDCRTETSPITVAANDGVVTLTGNVKYYAIKHAAEQAAHRIAGVRSVENRIDVKIPHTEYRGDCEVQEAVTNALTWNVLVPQKQISVTVEKGVVALTGAVECISQREEAESCAINLLGVRGIDNQIRVIAQSIRAEEICESIQSSLERQAVAGTQQVEVEIEGAAVHLKGSVPTWSHRCAVVSSAGFAHGVREVVDDLKVAVGA